MNSEEDEMVFRIDMEEVERLLTPIPNCMAIGAESNKKHNDRAELLTKEPKPRIAVAIAALIHKDRRTIWST